MGRAGNQPGSAVIGRLKPGMTVGQARQSDDRTGATWEEFPKPMGTWLCIQPLKETTVGGVRGSLWMLFGSVSLLLDRLHQHCGIAAFPRNASPA